MEKRCRVCREAKPLDQFYGDSAARDGRRPECKACTARRRKIWYEANREREIARVQAWREANKEHHREWQRGHRRRPEVKQRDKDLRYQRVYGITLEQYETTLAAQGGGCAICGKPPRDDISLHVDHDHTTGAVRGLLCFDCNAGVGKLGEDRERLQQAIAYLDHHDPELQELAAITRQRLRGLIEASR